MTLRNPILLLAVLASLLGGVGYSWIVPLFDNSPPGEKVIRPNSPGRGFTPSAVPRSEITVITEPIEAITHQAAAASSLDRLVGRVVDTDGNGLAGIRVHLRTERGTGRKFILRSAVTDVNGGFRLDDLDPSAVYLFFFEAFAEYPGYRLDGFTLDGLPAPFDIQLPVLDLVDIRGTVVDTEHVPIANFTLTVDNIDTNFPARTVSTDASGNFQLEAFPAGGLKIYTAIPEYFRIHGLYAGANEYNNLTLVIDRGIYSFKGRVHDENGAPIASARITLSSTISNNKYRSEASRTRMTDASGSFEFNGLGGIPHTLGVYANGYRPLIENHSFQSFSDSQEIRLTR